MFVLCSGWWNLKTGTPTRAASLCQPGITMDVHVGNADICLIDTFLFGKYRGAIKMHQEIQEKPSSEDKK